MEVTTLSPLTRTLVRAAAIAWALAGAVFFFLPGYAADNFPWAVTQFQAMTIGAWGLGTAAIAWEAARVWRFSRVYPTLTYVWLFGVLELVVVGIFADKLLTENWLTYPYLAALGLTALSGVVGAFDLVRIRPRLEDLGPPAPWWVRFLTIDFVIVVGVLWLGGAAAEAGGRSTSGEIFPEPLTLFTVRAFAVFFFALDIAALVLFASRTLLPYLELARTGLLLVIPILVATSFHLDAFDFAERPGGLLYIGAYLLTAVLATVSVFYFRRRGVVAGENLEPARA